MTIETTLSQLQRHASLEDSILGGTPTISGCTWLANGLAGHIADAADDVIQVLVNLNRQINGDMPSESISGDTMISRQIVFAITEIIRLLRSASDEAEDAGIKAEFRRQEWRISTAWYAVLSGDIDDVEQYIADEETAR